MVAATVVQVTSEKSNSAVGNYTKFVGAANALDNSGLQDVFKVNVAGLFRIAVRITVATNALAAFAILAKFNIDSTTYSTLKSTAAHFTSPSGVLVDVSGDLTTQAVGSGWFVLDVSGMAEIKIQANSSAAGGSTLAVSIGGV